MLERIKFTRAIAPSAGVAGTTTLNGATLDMANFEGVVAEVTFGVITAGALTTIKIQQVLRRTSRTPPTCWAPPKPSPTRTTMGSFWRTSARLGARCPRRRHPQHAECGRLVSQLFAVRAARVPVTSQGTGVISSEEWGRPGRRYGVSPRTSP